ncbi:hypothetical protein NQ318_002592 [Aromia moschata]|uniref:Uncharacterized protein n=1 Tax=Aromia moschata TaxID=1265417 RepID=A0AAV8XXX8_9CUCU|nr:hypothetical protein NQ318_002592 [Aromia moschata]
MLIKSATLLGLLALASAATIYQRNIPVEVRYDEPVAAESVRNLDIAAQQIPVDLKEKPAGPLLEPIVIEEKPNAVRNLDEKIQLSSEDLGQALKHLPVNQEPAPVEVSEKIEPTPEDLGETLNQLPVKQETAPVEVTEKVQPALEELSQTLKQLPVKQKPVPVEDLAVAETVQVTKIDDTPQIEEITRQPEVLKSVLQKAEDIIYSGLKNLRASFRPGESQQVPNAEQWDDLEKAVNQYLDEEKTKFQQKQSQPTTPGSGQNFFQNLASGFQTIANNFVQNLPGSQNVIENSTSQGDEQQESGSQGPFQGFVNYFQGGVNNIANAINNLGNPGSTTSNTVLGDTGDGPTTQAPGFISNFVNNVQQFFGQLQQGAQGAVPDVTQGRRFCCII